jgi:L-amino acid N-acyltransferase YncA
MWEIRYSPAGRSQGGARSRWRPNPGGGESVTRSRFLTVSVPEAGAAGGLVVRRATVEDAVACQAIYAPYVRDTVISLELDPPSVPEIEERMERCLETHDWLVLEDDGAICGYAYGSAYRSRAAYRWACEVSVYVEVGRRRTGAGRVLYKALFPRLVDRGYLTALAGMTLPNPASEGLHRSLGFEEVGTWSRIGWKFGAWHDVLWMQRRLAAGSEPPAELS